MEINTPAKNMHYSRPVLQEYYQQGTATDRASQRGQTTAGTTSTKVLFHITQTMTKRNMNVNRVQLLQYCVLIYYYINYVIFIVGKQFLKLHK